MLSQDIQALADRIQDVVGDDLASDGIDCEISPRFVPFPSESPCIDIFPGAPSRTSEMAAFGDVSGAYVVTVRARVTLADYDSSYDTLVDMTDDNHALSVAAALESSTLDCWVDADGFSGLIPMGLNGVDSIGCTWRVLISPQGVS